MSLRSDVDVSVVVPVFNTGEFIEPCIDSLVNQTLPADRYELIFVDDGSTDSTPERLDELAASTPNVRVFHEPNSGWPGRPRNIGIDNARGRYVFFCDHDDWLSPPALERMVDYADRTSADVLVPKMVGHGRSVPRELFRESLDNADVLTAPLMSSLTPHKLFRREFLNEIGLRFPEGKRRLEDHVFVITAYFRANRVAVLSDQSYYHHIRREDDANAAFDQVDPADYYRYVREVIDVIEANTEPGPERQMALDRPLVGSILNRLRRSRSHFKYSEDFQQRLFEEARAVLLECYPPTYGDHLGLITRLRIAALRDDRFDTITEINDRADALTATAEIRSIQWDSAAWRLEVEVQLGFGDGSPMRLIPVAHGRWTVDPRLLPDGETETARQEELAEVMPSVSLLERSSDDEWLLPAEFTVTTRGLPAAADGADAHEVVINGEITIDPLAAAGGSAIPKGLWDAVLRLGIFGVDLRTRLHGGEQLELAPAAGPQPRPDVEPFLTPSGWLAIDVGRRRSRRKKKARSGGGRAERPS